MILVNKHHQTSNLTFAVTLGFPSRSPPIHEPNLIGVQVSGSGLPVCYMHSIKMKDLELLEWVKRKLNSSSGSNCYCNLLQSIANTAKVSWYRFPKWLLHNMKTCMSQGRVLLSHVYLIDKPDARTVNFLPALASSTGVGLWRLNSSVCHNAVISLTCIIGVRRI